MELNTRIKYFSWAALRYPFANTTCPACQSTNTVRLKRKALVTQLCECLNCYLRFRIPKDTAQENEVFYQDDYEQGVTTECPTPAQLKGFLETSFAGSAKDFSTYIAVLRSLGLRKDAVVLDYGSSWGYGSWQIKQAGCVVYSFEISVPRAKYAADELGCQMLASPTEVPGKVDLLFSAHVIEHLPNPNIIWETARDVLGSMGTLVLFMPNGDPSREKDDDRIYHQLWGKVHPLLLSARALDAMAARHGFSGRAYSAPYDLGAIERGHSGDLSGDELLYVARKLPVTRGNSDPNG